MSRTVESVVAAALLCLSTLLVPTIDARADDAERPSPLRPGAWALQFTVREDFQLGSFNNSTLAIKRHTSARSAWRAGVDLRLNSENFEFEAVNVDTVLTLDEAELDHQALGGRVQFLRYFGAPGAMNPYVGFGPEVSWSHLESGQTGTSPRRSTSSWSVGGSWLLGTEWLVARSIGVHAEYTQSASYQRTKTERTYESGPSADKSELRIWRFAPAGVRFGLSAYF